MAKIKVGDLVDQLEGGLRNGLVIDIFREESHIKTDPSRYYDYAYVIWPSGDKQQIKLTFLQKIS